MKVQRINELINQNSDDMLTWWGGGEQKRSQGISRNQNHLRSKDTLVPEIPQLPAMSKIYKTATPALSNQGAGWQSCKFKRRVSFLGSAVQHLTLVNASASVQDKHHAPCTNQVLKNITCPISYVRPQETKTQGSHKVVLFCLTSGCGVNFSI